MSILGSSLIGFLIAIIILVAIHEFGHFYVARRCGVKVLEFAIGFGKPVWQFYRKNDPTQYSIRLIPLGGYVKMLDEREAPVAQKEQSLAYNNKSPAAKAAIVFAGPLANFIFAFIAMWLVLWVGQVDAPNKVDAVESESLAALSGFFPGDKIVAIDGRKNQTWGQHRLYLMHKAMNQKTVRFSLLGENGEMRNVKVDLGQIDDITRAPILYQLGLYATPPAAVVGSLVENQSAKQAGVQVGDKIIAIDNQSIAHWGELVRYISARPKQLMVLTVQRNGRSMEITLTSQADQFQGQQVGRIGIRPAQYQSRTSYSPLQSIWASIEYNYHMIAVNVKGIWMMLTGQMSLKNISGAITIAQFAGVTVESGLMDFIQFLAVISLSLGIINLLPIPVLDGGHLMYIGYEALTGKAPSEKFMLGAQQIGLFLILMLMTLAIFNDVTRLFGAN